MNGKGTDTFKVVIQNYLEYRASTDELFAPRFANPLKSIDECCKYIIGEVYKSGMNGFDDDEIFSMAVHYYDENEIEVGNPPQCRIISNVHTDLTEDFIIIKAVHSAFMHLANDVLATFIYALIGIGKQGCK